MVSLCLLRTEKLETEDAKIGTFPVIITVIGQFFVQLGHFLLEITLKMHLKAIKIT